MSGTPVHQHGTMEGKGAYNRHARIPAVGMSVALPVLEEAIAKVELDSHNQPVVVADYGSSQGKNSLTPMRVVTKKLREKLGADRPIFVFHIDQPTNDFNTLFEVLHSDADRYAQDDPNVFPCVIGRSFYESVLPQQSVSLGWSSYAAMWLSHIPSTIPGHFQARHATGAVRAAFDRQAAQDWETFLSLRARELRPGGRLVVVLAALDDDGHTGFEHLFDHANAVLAEMTDAGEIRAEERERMVLGTVPRRRAELLAPFQQTEHFEGLRVECCDLTSLADTAWADYERDHDAEALATKHTLFFRSIFIPSLALGLSEADNAERRIVFADTFEHRLKRRVANQPSPTQSFVQTMVLAKQD